MLMKHVVIAAPFRQTVLVTGFGAFPGARRNPTAMILLELARQRGALARLGIDLRCVLLPVVYAKVGSAIEEAVRDHRPDAILHLGLAARRRHIAIETRALNRAGPLRPDAAGALPRQVLAHGAPQALRSTVPAPRLAAALRHGGHDARLSIDAGDYVCNATLFHTLRHALAPSVGFIHVPRTRRVMASPVTRARAPAPATIDSLTRAVLLAVREIARGEVSSATPMARARLRPGVVAPGARGP